MASHTRLHWTVLTLFAVSLGMLATGCSLSSQSSSEAAPTQVTVDAGAPLSCELLTEPKVIGDVTATYSCAAPGAYLVSVDEENKTAEYFTTDSQSTTVTYGPETKPLIE